MIDLDIEVCADAGLQYAISIMPANSCTPYFEVTPEWVFEAGAAYTTYTNDCLDGKITLKAPVWNDPIFKSKLQDLINEMKARFDGHPDISFVDNRNCGKWGEWHSYGCDGSMDTLDKTALIDMFAGWETPVIIPTLFGDETHFMKGIDDHAHGCRRNSSNYQPEGCAYAYDKSIAISEWEAPYTVLKTCGGWSGFCWRDDIIQEYMRESRVSYDNMGQWDGDTAAFYNEKQYLVEEWANKMGYWFRITEATYSEDLGNGVNGSFAFTIRNDGVAPIYVNKQAGGQTYVKVALLDNNSEVLAVTTLDDINPFTWKPFNETNMSYREAQHFRFPHKEAGAKIAIGLFTDVSLENPDIKLGIEGRTPSGWYPLVPEQ